MTCPACLNDGRSEACAFCHREPTELESRLTAAKTRLNMAETIDVPVWACGDRQWASYAPGKVFEVTATELEAIRNGATLEEILEARRGQL